jgi:hypothetical protein
MAASWAATLLIAPLTLVEYPQMLRDSGVETEAVPCLSIILRLWLSPRTMSLQYLLTGLGCLWALAYYWRRRKSWDWLQDGSLPMLVSLVTAPFSWLYDSVVVIPPLLEGVFKTRSGVLLAVLALLSAAIEMSYFGVLGTIPVLWTMWTPLVWLVWYLCAGWGRGRGQQQP